MPKITCAIAPSGAGRIRHLPGFAAKPLASANCRAWSGNEFLIASQFALLANVMGMALAAAAVSNTEGMLVSGFLDASPLPTRVWTAVIGSRPTNMWEE